MRRFQSHFVLDVESDGPHPLDFNMISFALVSLTDPAKGFSALLQPIHENDGGWKAARDVSGISWERQRAEGRPTREVMDEVQTWAVEIAQRDRITIWSDNPAYDWQFWNAYTHHFTGRNVAGFSARRIGDLDAGRRGAPLTTNGWKKWRRTEHTHDPLDDARGNAEALRTILEAMEGGG